jgi:hypothetical protein
VGALWDIHALQLGTQRLFSRERAWSGSEVEALYVNQSQWPGDEIATIRSSIEASGRYFLCREPAAPARRGEWPRDRYLSKAFDCSTFARFFACVLDNVDVNVLQKGA